MVSCADKNLKKEIKIMQGRIFFRKSFVVFFIIPFLL